MQAVNDNSSSKITLKTAYNLALVFVALVHPFRFVRLITYALKALGSRGAERYF